MSTDPRTRFVSDYLDRLRNVLSEIDPEKVSAAIQQFERAHLRCRYHCALARDRRNRCRELNRAAGGDMRQAAVFGQLCLRRSRPARIQFQVRTERCRRLFIQALLGIDHPQNLMRLGKMLVYRYMVPID